MVSGYVPELLYKVNQTGLRGHCFHLVVFKKHSSVSMVMFNASPVISDADFSMLRDGIMYLLKVTSLLHQADSCVISACWPRPVVSRSKYIFVVGILFSICIDWFSESSDSGIYSVSRYSSGISPQFDLYIVPSRSSTDDCLLALSFFNSIRLLLNDL